MIPAASSGSALREDIDACGYFPDLVADIVAAALGDEAIVAHLVHHEATFDRDQVHRHLTVLVLTETRFLVTHTDEAEQNTSGRIEAATTSEVVPLTQLGTVSIATVVQDPENHALGRSSLGEVWLTVNWGTLRQIDLKPAGCDNPDCEADHGYTGTAAGEDLVIRMSAAADGTENLGRMVRFATLLQHRAGRR
ncbi:DUF5998 family protein [Propionicicella superfundia]|uniref:DUF5998 family protein n=1 Tax=Propionicicella superfundia TaxID=348582 RepID=UPI0003F8B5A0|nr:DUF5998 family protein [Propionicicella superfundia]